MRKQRKTKNIWKETQVIVTTSVCCLFLCVHCSIALWKLPLNHIMVFLILDSWKVRALTPELESLTDFSPFLKEKISYIINCSIVSKQISKHFSCFLDLNRKISVKVACAKLVIFFSPLHCSVFWKLESWFEKLSMSMPWTLLKQELEISVEIGDLGCNMRNRPREHG